MLIDIPLGSSPGRSTGFGVVVFALSAVLALGAVPPTAVAQELDPTVPACNEQEPFEFMVRENYVRRSGISEEEAALRRERHEQHVRYRTENYGYVEGFGEREWNDSTPADNASYIEFMGERVRLNERIHPALRCVEQAIIEHCADVPYQPSRLSGLRTRNTFRGYEVSNHMYGIAIDIDPSHNTCCGCVGEWAEHPLCRREVESIFERMIMPECWVHQFERFGFYWLGHDELQDTMHFEFLSDPNRILASEAAPTPTPEPEATPEPTPEQGQEP